MGLSISWRVRASPSRVSAAMPWHVQAFNFCLYSSAHVPPKRTTIRVTAAARNFLLSDRRSALIKGMVLEAWTLFEAHFLLLVVETSLYL